MISMIFTPLESTIGALSPIFCLTSTGALGVGGAGIGVGVGAADIGVGAGGIGVGTVGVGVTIGAAVITGSSVFSSFDASLHFSSDEARPS